MGMPTYCECGALFEWMDGLKRCKRCEIERLTAEGERKDEIIDEMRHILKTITNDDPGAQWRRTMAQCCLDATASGSPTPERPHKLEFCCHGFSIFRDCAECDEMSTKPGDRFFNVSNWQAADDSRRTPDRCPSCGYTQKDAEIHMDHRLCKNYGYFLNEKSTADSSQTDSRDYEALYFELIMEVAKKHPDESRHETAKRYIVERETPDPNACASAEKGHGHD